MQDYINEKDGELQLYAIVLPENAIDTTVNWSSANTAIATVSQQGLVHAKSDGVVTITAASNDNPAIKGHLCHYCFQPGDGCQSVRT